MPQLHFSVDDETVARLELKARQAGLTLPAYLARVARREGGEAWPEGYLERVLGSCAGLDLQEPADPLPDDVAL